MSYSLLAALEICETERVRNKESMYPVHCMLCWSSVRKEAKKQRDHVSCQTCLCTELNNTEHEAKQLKQWRTTITTVIIPLRPPFVTNTLCSTHFSPCALLKSPSTHLIPPLGILSCMALHTGKQRQPHSRLPHQWAAHRVR